VDAWADALVDLATDAERRTTLARRGHERAAGFTWVGSAHAHAAAYAAALDNS
jgi:hypothetical protein